MASPIEQALGSLREHVEKAEAVLRRLPHDENEDGPLFFRALAIAQSTLTTIESFTEGSIFPSEDAPHIVLRRRPESIWIGVDSGLRGAALEREVDTFVAALRRDDERMAKAAELLSLLCGLVGEWARAGFAPPVILLSLGKRAPRIIELGATQRTGV